MQATLTTVELEVNGNWTPPTGITGTITVWSRGETSQFAGATLPAKTPVSIPTPSFSGGGFGKALRFNPIPHLGPITLMFWVVAAS